MTNVLTDGTTEFDLERSRSNNDNTQRSKPHFKRQAMEHMAAARDFSEALLAGKQLFGFGSLTLIITTIS